MRMNGQRRPMYSYCQGERSREKDATIKTDNLQSMRLTENKQLCYSEPINAVKMMPASSVFARTNLIVADIDNHVDFQSPQHECEPGIPFIQQFNKQ